RARPHPRQGRHPGGRPAGGDGGPFRQEALPAVRGAGGAPRPVGDGGGRLRVHPRAPPGAAAAHLHRPRAAGVRSRDRTHLLGGRLQDLLRRRLLAHHPILRHRAGDPRVLRGGDRRGGAGALPYRGRPLPSGSMMTTPTPNPIPTSTSTPSSPRITTAVVLARGLGSRMRAAGQGGLSAEQAAAAASGHKALMPLGEHRLIDYSLSALADAGIRRAVLVVAPEHEEFSRHLAELAPSRLEVAFAVQAEPRGTADAVASAREAVGDAPFIMV